LTSPFSCQCRDTVCGFDGNADLYGIGVRVGLYLQWITTLLTTLFQPADERVLRVINLLIQSAIFIGLILLTNRQQVRAIEPIISIWLIFGALSSLSGSGMNPLGHFSGVYRILLYTAVAGYSCWFWFTGLDSLLSAEPGCVPIAFFDGISIAGRFRTFNKVASVLGLCICGVFIILTIRTFLIGPEGSNRRGRARRPRIQVEFFVTSTAIIGVSIAAVEYLVEANQITGINQTLSVSQLIPLLVGAFSFGEILLSVVMEGSYRRPRCWVLFGYHLS
jgi:hypothetical protein